eukprot:GHVP01060102.1.p1 GENE.GHVP01060102.1~~GHVP01060102.1.p1  ORF type:complete len:679 (-),score=118.70 GHVP01060102.1:2948-4960(-)
MPLSHPKFSKLHQRNPREVFDSSSVRKIISNFPLRFSSISTCQKIVFDQVGLPDFISRTFFPEILNSSLQDSQQMFKVRFEADLLPFSQAKIVQGLSMLFLDNYNFQIDLLKEVEEIWSVFESHYNTRDGSSTLGNLKEKIPQVWNRLCERIPIREIAGGKYEVSLALPGPIQNEDSRLPALKETTSLKMSNSSSDLSTKLQDQLIAAPENVRPANCVLPSNKSICKRRGRLNLSGSSTSLFSRGRSPLKWKVNRNGLSQISPKKSKNKIRPRLRQAIRTIKSKSVCFVGNFPHASQLTSLSLEDFNNQSQTIRTVVDYIVVPSSFDISLLLLSSQSKNSNDSIRAGPKIVTMEWYAKVRILGDIPSYGLFFHPKTFAPPPDKISFDDSVEVSIKNVFFYCYHYLLHPDVVAPLVLDASRNVITSLNSYSLSHRLDQLRQKEGIIQELVKSEGGVFDPAIHYPEKVFLLMIAPHCALPREYRISTLDFQHHFCKDIFTHLSTQFIEAKKLEETRLVVKTLSLEFIKECYENGRLCDWVPERFLSDILEFTCLSETPEESAEPPMLLALTAAPKVFERPEDSESDFKKFLKRKRITSPHTGSVWSAKKKKSKVTSDPSKEIQPDSVSQTSVEDLPSVNTRPKRRTGKLPSRFADFEEIDSWKSPISRKKII